MQFIFPKYYNFNFFYIAAIFFLFSFFLNVNNYVGNKLLFLILNICSMGLFLTIIRKNVPAFEFFLAFFLLLSFWFKFSCILFFENIKVTEGDFDLLISNYDEATIVIIFTFIAFILVSFLRELTFNYFFKKKKFIVNNFILSFYSRYRVSTLIAFIIILLFFWITNFYYGIYAKGIVNQNIPILIKYLYSWMFTYGLSVFVSLLIFFDFCIFHNKKYFFLGFLETFFSHITIFSRSFVLSFFAYSRGFLLLTDYKKISFSKFFIIKTTIVALILFCLSFYAVVQLRNINFVKSEFVKSKPLEFYIDEVFSLSVGRWVGIDALLSVSQNENNGFELFKSSLLEKKQIRKKSFYIENFFKDFKYSKTENEKFNIVITPGIVAYLYYSGSLVFVFSMIILIIFICSMIEKLFLHFSGNNFILSNIIGYALATRVAHFGYVPYNTINYLLSLVGTLILVIIISRIIWRINKT